jgi:hypothetical protein
MTNLLTSVFQSVGCKSKICNNFWKTNFDPEPNNQLSDSYHKLVIRHPQVMLLTVMAQYWIEELPSDAPLALELSERLRLF